MTELVLPRVRRRRIKPPHPWWLRAAFFSSIAVALIAASTRVSDWRDVAFIVSGALYLRLWAPQLRSYSRLVLTDEVGGLCGLAGVALSITASLA